MACFRIRTVRSMLAQWPEIKLSSHMINFYRQIRKDPCLHQQIKLQQKHKTDSSQQLAFVDKVCMLQAVIMHVSNSVLKVDLVLQATIKWVLSCSCIRRSRAKCQFTTRDLDQDSMKVIVNLAKSKVLLNMLMHPNILSQGLDLSQDKVKDITQRVQLASKGQFIKPLQLPVYPNSISPPSIGLINKKSFGPKNSKFSIQTLSKGTRTKIHSHLAKKRGKILSQ